MLKRHKRHHDVSTSSPEYEARRREEERGLREEERELLQLKRDVLRQEVATRREQQPSDVDTARDDTVALDPASALKRLQRREEAKRSARKNSPEQQRDAAA